MTTLTPERTTTTTKDPEDAAHIVLSPDPAEGSHAYVMRARLEGFPVTALCGHVFVVTKQATGRPICQPCKEIFEDDPQGHGDRDRMPDE